MASVQSTPSASAMVGLSDGRLYLVGGWGALLAAVSWIVQPILVLTLASGEGAEFPSVEFLLANPWLGPLEAAVFAGIGLGLLLLVLAVWTLLTRRAEAVSITALMGHVLGVLAGCIWILLAGWHLGPFTSVGEALSEAAPDSALQQAALHIHNVGSTSLIIASGLAFAGWLVVIAVAGRAHRVIGRPLAVVALVAAIVVVLPVFMPFSPPWGVIGMQAFALVAGVGFLLKARTSS